MAKEGVETRQTTKICLFDFDRDVLAKIFTNETVSHLLEESGNSGFLDDMAIFLDFTAEESMWCVREEDKEVAKEQWSFQLPVEIAEAIGKIADEYSREKASQSVGDL